MTKTMMMRLQINDASIADEGYYDLLTSIDRKPFPSVDGLRNIRRLMVSHNPKVAKVKIEEIIDNRSSESWMKPVTWTRWRRGMG